jgi:hypothetical protein
VWGTPLGSSLEDRLRDPSLILIMKNENAHKKQSGGFESLATALTHAYVTGHTYFTRHMNVTRSHARHALTRMSRAETHVTRSHACHTLRRTSRARA